MIHMEALPIQVFDDSNHAKGLGKDNLVFGPDHKGHNALWERTSNMPGPSVQMIEFIRPLMLTA